MTGRLADLICAYVAAQRSSRVDVADLLRHATSTDPTLVGDPAARARLSTALADLAEAGLVVLPKTHAGWDHRTQPPLPLWLAKPATSRPSRPAPATRVWPQPLEAAAAIATRSDEHTLLERIAAWLRDNPDPVPVPIEERSLEILDDEKALTAATTKRLFTTGALSLDLLACYPTPVPFPSQHVPGTGETGLLVAENNATFHSLLTLARELDQDARPDIHVGWGCGNQFPVSIGAVTLLDPPPTALYYIGDLDVAGLRIAGNAAAAAADRRLPRLRPAAALYRWLLARGTPRPDRSNTGTADVATLTAWLPPDLREPCARLLSGRQRIPQETLGLRALRANAMLLREAVAR